MDVGYLILCASDGWNDVTDAQVYREEVELARMADDLGFSVIWAVEHHFDGYSFVPDNALMAAHLAATCKNADVGTAAFILPWHDPLRVRGANHDARPFDRREATHRLRPGSGADGVQRLP